MVPMQRVFLTAAPRARRFALPNLIAGFEIAIKDECHEVMLKAVHHAPGDPHVKWLRGRPTGQVYRNLPLWEADVVE